MFFFDFFGLFSAVHVSSFLAGHSERDQASGEHDASDFRLFRVCDGALDADLVLCARLVDLRLDSRASARARHPARGRPRPLAAAARLRLRGTCGGALGGPARPAHRRGARLHDERAAHSLLAAADSVLAAVDARRRRVPPLAPARARRSPAQVDLEGAFEGMFERLFERLGGGFERGFEGVV